MKLEKSFIIDGRVKGKKVLGMMFGSYVLYENTNYWSMSYTRNDDFYGNQGRPMFNSDFKYTTETKRNPDSTITVTIIAENIDDMPEFIQFNYDNIAAYLIAVDSIADTYGITGISFAECKELKSVDLSNVDTSNTTYMASMFLNCESLTTLNLARFNTSKAEDMGFMFRGCTTLTELDLSSFDVKNAMSLSQMFYGCYSLQSLNLSNFDISENAGTTQMFTGCRRLIELRLDGCNNYTIDRIINSDGFPTGSISISDTRLIYCKESERRNLEPPDGWDFSYVPEEPEVPEIPEEPDVPEVPEEPEIPLYEKDKFKGNATIETVETMVNASHTDLSEMFDGCFSLKSVNTEDWNTTNVTTMREMFQNCRKLTTLDLSNWKVENVTDMNNMFYGCVSLTELDLSNWVTSNVTETNNMFSSCINLEVLDIRNFKAPASGQTDSMFVNCSKLRVIRMDNCDIRAIRRFIVNQEEFPTGTINGEKRVIYCKESNLIDSYGNRLVPPTDWRFEIVPEEQ